MADWSFLTNHARVLLCIARDPDIRIRAIALTLDVTERTAHSVVRDLTDAGYVVKERDGRRNRYHIQAHLPLQDAASRQRPIGELLDLLVDNDDASPTTRHAPASERPRPRRVRSR